MSLQDKLKASGFTPEANTEGEWQPYNGTYRGNIRTLRVEFDEKNQADFIQAEYDIEESLSGDPKRDSKFPAFRKRYYVDFSDSATDSHVKNAKKIANDIFTATALELDFSSKEKFVESAEKVIGKDIYIRAWGWTPEKDVSGNPVPEDKKKKLQQFSVQKKAVAEKKRSADTLSF